MCLSISNKYRYDSVLNFQSHDFIIHSLYNFSKEYTYSFVLILITSIILYPSFEVIEIEIVHFLLMSINVRCNLSFKEEEMD